MSEALLLLSRLGIGAIFLLAGFTKARDLARFKDSLATYRIPSQVRKLVPATLPVAELLLGSLLILGVAPVPTAVIASALLLSFVAATLKSFGLRDKVDCGCLPGRLFDAHTASSVVLRDVGLMIAVGSTAAFPLSGTSAAFPLSGTPTDGLGMQLAVTAAIAGCLWLLARISRGFDFASPGEDVSQPGRRAFFQKTALFASSAVGLAVISRLAGIKPAEAACYGCGSCSPDMFFIACNGNCCADYWTRQLNYCSPYCQASCGGYYVVEQCGVPQCC